MRTSIAFAVLLLLLAAACDDSSGGTGDDTPGADAAPPSGLATYYGRVEPILFEHCTRCHHGDAATRLAPFPLLTYQDALDAAKNWGLAYAVENRVMPPYLARDDGSCNDVANADWLDDAEIATLVEWANGPGLEGDPALALPPPTGGAALSRVDRTLDPGADWTPAPVGGDQDTFRCFVVDPALASDQFLTGFQVKPGDRREVHHVILYLLDSEQAEAQAEALDADAVRGAGVGYDCEGGNPGVDGSTFIAGWVPGNEAIDYPAGTGIRIPAGRKLVYGIHYNHAQGAFPDRTTIDLRLETQVAKEATIFAIADTQLSIAPGQPLAVETATRTLPAGVGTVQVWGGAGHMHQRGVSLDVSGAAGACALDIPRWDFNWQHFYFFAKPMTMKGGDPVTITCRYDSTADTSTVTWGEGTGDEMCIAYFYATR